MITPIFYPTATAAACAQLTGNGERILKSDFVPGFYIKHFVKIMSIALEEADKLNVPAPVLKHAKSLYGILIWDGLENLGAQALYRLYSKGTSEV
jgi:3-hydroxyisobutyrate dehydrogenase